jgi:hypothetical protein
VKTKDESKTISFRLPATLAERLSELGAVGGMSPGEYARSLIMRELSDTHRVETSRTLADMRGTLDRLREDIATVATALLSKNGPVPTREAKEWVRRTLLT